jgi:N-acetylglucosaminyldiphosphoundecaprenol N-acetyl-beta-D-mannosaminyltransferase
MYGFFGVTINTESKPEIERFLSDRVMRGAQTSIATLNAEILLAAKQDPRFRDTLMQCTLRCVDGFGITLSAWLKFHIWAKRIVGRDLVAILMGIAQKNGLTVGVLGGEQGIASRAAVALQNRYPQATVVDLSCGQSLETDREGIIKEHEVLEKSLAQYKPSIVLAGFGAPKQERWIVRTLASNPTIKAAIGVGGILDVLAGKLPAPPRFFSSLGLEWLWRVIIQPKRIGRIFRAVFVFPFQALFFDTPTR